MLLNTIYKTTTTGKTQQWQIEVVGNKLRTISGQVGGKLVTSEWTVVYGKNDGRSNATTDEEQAMKEAESRRTHKLERGYFEDIVDIDNEQYFKPMLAKKWEDYKDKVSYPLYSQAKLDGIRCIVKSDGMWSRNGKKIVSAPHIYESIGGLFDIYPDLILDGELYADKFANDFNKIVSLVKKTKPTAEDLAESKAAIEYHIYDLPSSKKNFLHRIWDVGVLFGLHSELHAHCGIVNTYPVDNEADVDNQFGMYVSMGYEGQMLRLDKPYENKRSNSLLKHKTFTDDEFVILDITEGEGNRTGTAGYFTFQTKEGKPFTSNVKGSREETAEMLRNKADLIGKTATVKYFALTPDGLPRFPVVININRESYE